MSKRKIKRKEDVTRPFDSIDCSGFSGIRRQNAAICPALSVKNRKASAFISRYDTGVFYSAIVSDGVSNPGIISFKPSLAFL